jgi:hypothetical protein
MFEPGGRLPGVDSDEPNAPSTRPAGSAAFVRGTHGSCGNDTAGRRGSQSPSASAAAPDRITSGGGPSHPSRIRVRMSYRNTSEETRKPTATPTPQTAPISTCGRKPVPAPSTAKMPSTESRVKYAAQGTSPPVTASR